MAGTAVAKKQPAKRAEIVPAFAWADDKFGSKEDAQKVGIRLGQIYRREGALVKDTIVEDAKAKDSPLHGFFEWDDQKAGQLYRLRQAGGILTSIRLIANERTEPELRQVFVCVEPHTDRSRFVTVRQAEKLGHGKHGRCDSLQDRRDDQKLTGLYKLEAWMKEYGQIPVFRRLQRVLTEIREELLDEGELTGKERMTTCLSCDRPFLSPDPTKIRRCGDCKVMLDGESE